MPQSFTESVLNPIKGVMSTGRVGTLFNPATSNAKKYVTMFEERGILKKM